jgi:hypothetical protein
LTDVWQKIPQYWQDELFNGVEAVRFDYTNKRAYVSVAFSAWSNDIYVKISDPKGNGIPITYVGITDFYDNRRVVVCWTIDDVGMTPDGNTNFLAASRAFADAQVWWTPSINTESWWWGIIESGNYSVYQIGINNGFTEMSAHSRTHPQPPYADYDAEIGGCKDDIINHLDLPYKKGMKEYVWSWVEPSGESDAMVLQKLGEYKYLASRTVAIPNTDIWQGTGGASPWASFDAVNNLYARAVPSVFLDAYSLANANTVFDKVHASGGIYLVYGHIGSSWNVGDQYYEHLQHVKGKADVWYVGFGQTYAYHYTQKVAKVVSYQ